MRIIKIIKSKFLNAKINSKIIICYLLLLVFSTVLSTFTYQKINSKIMSDKVSELSIQTIKSIGSNIDLVIETVNDYSKMLIYNEDIQTILKSAPAYGSQAKMISALTGFVNFNTTISSIYIFDNNGNKYYVDKDQFKEFELIDIKKSDYYNALVKSKGAFMIKLNAGGLFNKSENYVSLIRQLNDINTQQPIGIVIINISEKAISKSYKDIISRYENTIYVKDENNKDIIKAGNDDIFELNKYENYSTDEEDYSKVIKAGGNQYLLSYLKQNNYNWRIISVMPFQELTKQSDVFRVTAFIIITINSILLFLGSILISKFITNPIHKLIKSMKGIEKGEFKQVNIAAGNDEIGKLRDVYNIMINQIEQLIAKIILEQKIKRKAELDVLQAQIKPHFLYNTFDALSSLTLSGKAQEAYTLIKALGSFYRTSLNNGREIISVREELETVKNYIIIQKIRYEDLLTVNYDIDINVNECKILKLILQPFVENSIQHGIMCREGKGSINITTRCEDNFIKIIVEDNGVGMSEEQLQKIKTNEMEGIGVRATIERLRIFYNVEEVFEIESKEGEGTKVTITIPMGGVS